MKLYKQNKLYAPDGVTGNAEENKSAPESSAISTEEMPNSQIDNSKYMEEEKSFEDMEKELFGEEPEPETKADSFVGEDNTNSEDDSVEGNEDDTQESDASVDDELETTNTSNQAEDTEPGNGKTVENNKFFEINEQYIQDHPEDAELLSKIRGQTTSPQLLKNYLHSQRYIEQLKAEQENSKPDNNGYESPNETIALHELEADKLQLIKANRITAEMKKQYPDFPDDALTDRDSLNAFYSDLQYDRPADFDDMKATLKHITDVVASDVDRKVSIGRNWKQFAAQTLQDGFDSFEEYLAKSNVKASDLGISKFDAELAKSIVYDENGNLNSDVVFIRDGIPVIMKNRFISALKEKYTDAIINVRSNAARAEGFERRNKTTPPPSISNSQQRKASDARSLPNTVDDEMSFEQMEKVLDKM